MKHLRALTFDLDDTLWDNGPVLKAAEQTLYDWLAHHYPRIKARYSPEGMYKLRRDLLQRNPELGHDVTKLRQHREKELPLVIAYLDLAARKPGNSGALPGMNSSSSWTNVSGRPEEQA